MAVALARIAYTYHKRRQSKDTLFPIACNAFDTETAASSSAEVLPEYQVGKDKHFNAYSIIDEKQAVTSLSTPIYTEEEGEEGYLSAHNQCSNIESPPSLTVKPSIGLFPQYLTKTPQSITISEVEFPKLSSSFHISDTKTSQPLFTVHRDRPSLSNHQLLIDAQTQQPILSIRRSKLTLPICFTFSDPEDNQILSLNGDFAVPTQGSRATVLFTNVMQDEGHTCASLSMKSTWRNRQASIVDNQTGEVLAEMDSEVFNVKNLVGRRRTYALRIIGGVDVAMVVAMIVSLDARSS